MKLPNNEKISNDIYHQIENPPTHYINNVGISMRKNTINDDHYTNFITFLKNSFEYDKFHDDDLNIVDYVDNFYNLGFFFKIINKHNVYVVDTPIVQIVYLSDDNKFQILRRMVTEMTSYGFIDIINNPNKIFLLYMIKDESKGAIRYLELDDNLRYIQFDTKGRKKNERREKINEIQRRDQEKIRDISFISE